MIQQKIFDQLKGTIPVTVDNKTLTINKGNSSMEIQLKKDTITSMNPILGKVYVQNKDQPKIKINYSNETVM